MFVDHVEPLPLCAPLRPSATRQDMDHTDLKIGPKSVICAKKSVLSEGRAPFEVVEGRAPRGLRGFVRFHCACPRDKDRPISSCCLVLRRRPGVSSDTYDTLNEFFSNLILLPIIQIQIPLLITVNHHRQQQ